MASQAPPKFNADGEPDVAHDPVSPAISRQANAQQHDTRTDYPSGPWICPVDPAVAADRQAPKAESNSAGAVARTIGAFPAAEAETGSLSLQLALIGGSLLALVGAASGREAGGVRPR